MDFLLVFGPPVVIAAVVVNGIRKRNQLKKQAVYWEAVLKIHMAVGFVYLCFILDWVTFGIVEGSWAPFAASSSSSTSSSWGGGGSSSSASSKSSQESTSLCAIDDSGYGCAILGFGLFVLGSITLLCCIWWCSRDTDDYEDQEDPSWQRGDHYWDDVRPVNSGAAPLHSDDSLKTKHKNMPGQHPRKILQQLRAAGQGGQGGGGQMQERAHYARKSSFQHDIQRQNYGGPPHPPPPSIPRLPGAHLGPGIRHSPRGRENMRRHFFPPAGGGGARPTRLKTKHKNRAGQHPRKILQHMRGDDGRRRPRTTETKDSRPMLLELDDLTSTTVTSRSSKWSR